MRLCVDATEVLVLDADLVPTGEVRQVTTAEDLRSCPPLGDRRLDHVYVRAKGPAVVRLETRNPLPVADDALVHLSLSPPLEHDPDAYDVAVWDEKLSPALADLHDAIRLNDTLDCAVWRTRAERDLSQLVGDRPVIG